MSIQCNRPHFVRSAVQFSLPDLIKLALAQRLARINSGIVCCFVYFKYNLTMHLNFISIRSIRKSANETVSALRRATPRYGSSFVRLKMLIFSSVLLKRDARKLFVRLLFFQLESLLLGEKDFQSIKINFSQRFRNETEKCIFFSE